MALEKCRHPYYRYVEGVLICTECKKQSPKTLVETKDQHQARQQITGPKRPRVASLK